MPSEWQRAQTMSGSYGNEILYQEKAKNPKLKGNVVTMFFIFLQEMKNNTELQQVNTRQYTERKDN